MPPTVVMLSWEYPPRLVGGLGRHVHALSRELVRQGVRIFVLTRGGPGLPEYADDEGVQVIRVAPLFFEPSDFLLWVCHLNFALSEAGARLLRTLEGPVIVHAHDWLVAAAGRGLAQLFQAPLVATIHATEYGRNGGIHSPAQQYISDVEWRLACEARRVVVCSEAMRIEVQQLFGVAEEKVTVIPNGIDLPTVGSDEAVPPRDAFAGFDERLLFHIGRLVPEKGAALLVEALPLLLQRHNLRLVIAGTGPFRPELEQRANALGVADRIRFTGYVPDGVAQALYRYADATVVPSTYEPFGIVALEAMAAGAPLVASNVGGLAGIVHHEVNGLCAIPGDVRSLVEQIDRLLTDRLLARRLAAEAARWVREHYSWEGVAQATRAAYQAVLEPSDHSEAAVNSPGRHAI